MNAAKSVTFSDRNFATEVLDSPLPVVVDVWAPWCGPCRVMNPIIENIAAQFAGVVKVGKLNADENDATATQYQVQAIPTLLVFQNGKLVDRVTGLISQEALAEKLRALLLASAVA